MALTVYVSELYHDSFKFHITRAHRDAADYNIAAIKTQLSNFNDIKKMISDLGIKDSVEDNRSYCFTIKGPSNIQRAYHGLSALAVTFDDYNTYPSGYGMQKPKDWAIEISRHALKMTETECLVCDLNYVKQAHDATFVFLARSIKELHETNPTMHSTREKLDAIITRLAKYDYKHHFEKSAYVLLLSSLIKQVVTIHVEQSKLTSVEKLGASLSKIFSKHQAIPMETRLLNPYAELICGYEEYIPTIYYREDMSKGYKRLIPDLDKLHSLFIKNRDIVEPLVETEERVVSQKVT